MISYNEFFENFSRLQDEVATVAREVGRSPSEIKIIPVTKTHPAAAVEYSQRAGLTVVGENRVQEAASKKSELTDIAVQWDLIGHLQSNKAAQAVATFDRVQSLDSLKLARRLDRFAGEAGKALHCLVQVNTGEDPRKYGFRMDGFEREVGELVQLQNIRIDGLMTIAPLEDSTATARETFARLRSLAEKSRQDVGLELPELSMGMSGDWAEAVQEGSTMIRVGSALFGARK